MAIKAATLLTLEKALINKLIKQWRKDNATVLVAILAQAKQADFLAAQATTNNLTLLTTGNKLKKAIHTHNNSAVIFGGAMLNGITKVNASSTLLPIIDIATTNFITLLGQANTTIIASITRAIIKAEKRYYQTLKKSDILQKADVVPPVIIADLKTEMDKGALNTIEIGSSLHTSRLSTWGYCHEAQLLGITTYMIQEQLDRRICPVCSFIHGETFKVEEAFTQVDNLVRMDDPDELKAANPWVKQDKKSLEQFYQTPRKELISKGWHKPPFHPRCRGLMVHAGYEQITVSDTSYELTIPIERKVKNLGLWDQYISEQATSLVSPEVLKRELNRKLVTMVATGILFTRINASELTRALPLGHIPNPATSNSTQEVLATYKGITKKEVEQELLGVPPDAPTEELPIYGYMTDQADGLPTDPFLISLGDIVIVLNSALVSRTTFIGGDDLDDALLHSSATPELITAPTLAALPAPDFGEDITTGELWDHIDKMNIQTYGGLALTDIALVLLPSENLALSAALDEAGILWEVT